MKGVPVARLHMFHMVLVAWRPSTNKMNVQATLEYGTGAGKTDNIAFEKSKEQH